MSYDPSAGPPFDRDGGLGQNAWYPAYGGTPYGAPSQYGPPPAYRGWAIATLVLGIFGGLPGIVLGIFALIESEKVMRRWYAGDAAGAARASRITITLCIVNAALWVIGMLAVIFLVFFVHSGLPS